MHSIEIFSAGDMIGKKQKLELTWIGKENQPRLEAEAIFRGNNL